MGRPGELRLKIIQALAEFEDCRPDHLTEITGSRSSEDNPYQNVYAQLSRLEKDGLIARTNDPDNRFGLCLCYLTRKGWEKAVEYGYAPEAYRVENSRSNITYHHRLLITEFHLSLWRMFGDRLIWKQRNLKKQWGPRDGASAIIPDALFCLQGESADNWFYLELERTLRDKKEKNGKLSRINKIEAYTTFGDNPNIWGDLPFDNFRVLVVLPTEEKVQNFIEKMEKENLDSGRFSLTSHKGMLDPNDLALRSWYKSKRTLYSLSNFKS